MFISYPPSIHITLNHPVFESDGEEKAYPLAERVTVTPLVRLADVEFLRLGQ
jgi:hypothetical protein